MSTNDTNRAEKIKDLALDYLNDKYDDTFKPQGYSNGEAVTSLTSDGVTVEFDKGSGSTAPAYYDSGSAVRLGERDLCRRFRKSQKHNKLCCHLPTSKRK